MLFRSHTLQALKKWCYDHVSRDYQPTEHSYDAYLTLARYYLDDFLPRTTDINSQLIEDATRYGFDHFLSSLRCDKALLNNTNAYQMTPLHIAASLGHEHTVHALLTHGASPLARNAQEELPIHRALLTPIDSDAEQIKKRTRIFHALLEKAPDVLESTNNSGDTVFHLMASQGFSNLLQAVVPDTYHHNHQLHYPIHIAILNNQINAAKTLLSQEKVKSELGPHDQNALHYATRYGIKTMVEACIKAMPDALDAKDQSGKTPLILAAEAENHDAIECLLTHGANKDCVDNYHKTFQDYIDEKSNPTYRGGKR